MDLKDIRADTFFKKFTYSADPNPKDKIVMSAGNFVIAAVLLKLCNEINRKT